MFFNNIEKDEMYSRWSVGKEAVLLYRNKMSFPSFSSIMMVRKNIFTVLYVFKKEANAINVIRSIAYLLRMGVNIRFGLVFGFETEKEEEKKCMERCLFHLYYATKKKYGLEM